VLYCTHVLDGLDGWATHLLRLRPGGLPAELLPVEGGPAADAPGALLARLLPLLREDAEVGPAPLPEPRAASGAAEELPTGWGDRGTAHAGAFGKHSWNAERGPEDVWSYGSVAPEPPQMPAMGGGQPAGLAAAGPGNPLAAAPSPWAPAAPGGQGFGAFGGLGGAQAARSDPCPFGFGARTNAMPLSELVARGVVQPEAAPR